MWFDEYGAEKNNMFFWRLAKYLKHQSVLFIIVFFLTENAAADYRWHMSTAGPSADYVILVHGLRGSRRSFSRLEKALRDEGYNVCLVEYPSTRDSIKTLAETAIGGALQRCQPADSARVHFVAHSMGAILVRYYLQQHKPSNLGRVVLLSPPNQGTELVDAFRWSWFFRRVNGPAGMALGTHESEFIQYLRPPDYQLGVIMSSISINPLASLFIPGKDDGRVAVKSAAVEGMRDFVLVRCNHHVIMKKRETIQFVLAFLEKGRFQAQ